MTVPPLELLTMSCWRRAAKSQPKRYHGPSKAVADLGCWVMRCLASIDTAYLSTPVPRMLPSARLQCPSALSLSLSLPPSH